MSLRELKSLYDRNTRLSVGNKVGQNPPSSGQSNDHMVDLLTKVVSSTNSGTSYNPSPNENSNSNYQDLDGAEGSQFQLGRAAASKKHIDSLTKQSTYTHGLSTEIVGPTPGGDSNSPFQDLNGNLGPSFGEGDGKGKRLGGKDLHEHLLEKSYTYGHAPGFFTTVLGENEQGKQGGTFDLDGIDGGNGFFHGLANPGRGQGFQLGGKDLHRHLLTKNTILGGPGTNTKPYTIGPSPGPSGFSDYQDLDGKLPTLINQNLGQFGGPYKSTGPADGFY